VFPVFCLSPIAPLQRLLVWAIVGSIEYVQVPENKRTKLNEKCRKLMFVGYSDRHTTY
jgi:hypothetical protein